MRVLALTPICILKKDCKFEITPEVEEVIEEVFQNELVKLDNLIKEGKFATCDTKHTLLKEVPELNYVNLFTTIKQTVQTDIIKDRLVKL